jgi:hypothetical protein
MSRNCRSPIAALFCLIGQFSGMGMATTLPAMTVCSSTPSVRWDTVLRQRWVTIASCDHPERPAFARQAVLDKGTHRQLDQTHQGDPRELFPVVRAGDIVRLWRQEDHLRIEVAAVSEESGSLGRSVHVRLIRANSADQQVEQQFVGIVRGPADVEMGR